MAELIMTCFGIGLVIGLTFAFVGNAVAYAKLLFNTLGRR